MTINEFEKAQNEYIELLYQFCMFDIPGCGKQPMFTREFLENKYKLNFQDFMKIKN